ncbi:3-dehydroquinate synthase family protein [Halobacteriovorax sp. HLS]|uniref:3-dehydroquinate synthase n=1 Tax=Halobacteriovorax sp. HLS TaxID=2234000 RepID=UPI0013E29AC6|nr:3-dehydroquinate synthase family protein [Halobacteriovorax sp. HLS]
MDSKIEFCEIDKLVSSIEKIETDQILLIADLNVWGMYSKIVPLLELKGKKVIFWKAPDGEKVKTFENLNSAVNFFLSKNVHRNAHLISLGGGATSDFSGMVAAILLRGIKWSTIPTTLLSMVDAGIGGKVAINSAHGKNLIGAFHHPENIWIAHEFLETLPKEEFQSGLGEIIKYAFLNKEINNSIKTEEPLLEIIKKCVLYKEAIVKEDFKEKGQRKILNFGHTLGHAIETTYSLSHGISVCWGIAIVLGIFQKKNLLSELNELKELLSLDLEDSPWLNKTFPISDIMRLVKKDKKSTSSTEMDFIFCEEIGTPTIEKISFEKIEKTLMDKSDELRKLSI